MRQVDNISVSFTGFYRCKKFFQPDGPDGFENSGSVTTLSCAWIIFRIRVLEHPDYADLK